MVAAYTWNYYPDPRPLLPFRIPCPGVQPLSVFFQMWVMKQMCWHLMSSSGASQQKLRWGCQVWMLCVHPLDQSGLKLWSFLSLYFGCLQNFLLSFFFVLRVRRRLIILVLVFVFACFESCLRFILSPTHSRTLAPQPLDVSTISTLSCQKHSHLRANESRLFKKYHTIFFTLALLSYHDQI